MVAALRATIRFVIAVPLAALLLAANANIALGHWSGCGFGSYHWNKTGSQIVITQSWDGGAYPGYAEQARLDGWNKINLLYNYASSSHADLSAYSVNLGNDGNRGRFQLMSADWDWGSGGYCHITHGHAYFNEWYAGPPNYFGALTIQGIYCQELAHGWGLDHSATFDCMGLGYAYIDTYYYYGPHNNQDFTDKYLNH